VRVPHLYSIGMDAASRCMDTLLKVVETLLSGHQPRELTRRCYACVAVVGRKAPDGSCAFPESLAGIGMAFKFEKGGANIVVTGLSPEGSAAQSRHVYKGSVICKV
jgi:hypothetical protein